MTHGKAWMYTNKKCWPPCPACHAAHMADRKLRYRRVVLRQVDTRVPADKTMTMILQLHDRKIPYTEIARRTGLTNAQVGRIARNTGTYVYTSTEEAVQKVYNDVMRSGERNHHLNQHRVSSELSRKALRGLAAQGWSRESIRERIGLDLSTIWEITAASSNKKHRRTVLKSTEDKILALVREIGSADGGNNITRAKSMKKKWKPTMYWDELV